MLEMCLSMERLLLSWHFLTYSHQSRAKSTLGILKGFILCREGQQSTETHKFSATKGEGAFPPYCKDWSEASGSTCSNIY